MRTATVLVSATRRKFVVCTLDRRSETLDGTASRYSSCGNGSMLFGVMLRSRRMRGLDVIVRRRAGILVVAGRSRGVQL